MDAGMDERNTDLKQSVLIFAPSFYPAVQAGGPARSLTNLADALSERYRITVVTADRDYGVATPYPGRSGSWLMVGNARTFYLNVRSPAQWVTLLTSLRDRKHDLVLLNSVWNPGFAILPALLSLMGLVRGPIVVMPRGELERGALAVKSRKKRMLGTIVRGLYRRVISGIGATSGSEADAASAWFPDAQVMVTTNMPDVIPFSASVEKTHQFRLVFLSRINEKKGLLYALLALRSVTQPVKFTVAGPVDGVKYWDECREVIRSLPANVEPDYVETVSREGIPALLWESHAMVLLTAGENYGHVIAESLQAGCPVITTPTTPWTRVIRAGGGEIIEDRTDLASISSAFSTWASKSSHELAEHRWAARRAFDEFSADSQPNIVDVALNTFAASTPRQRKGW